MTCLLFRLAVEQNIGTTLRAQKRDFQFFLAFYPQTARLDP